jgi:protein SCO1
MRKPILYALAALLAALAGVLAWQMTPAGGGSPTATGTPRIGGPFALTDQNGQPRSSGDFRGRWLLVYFGYTSCPDVCPTELAKMGAALAAFEKTDAARGAAVLPLFITVDPGRDTPAALKQYVPGFHPRLIGLTGSQAQTDAVIAAYRVYAKAVRTPGDDPKNYPVDHTSLIYLMGPDGNYVAHFTNANTVAEIADGLRQHLR